MRLLRHHYIERHTGAICLERLAADRGIHWMYSGLREHAPTLFRVLTGSRTSHWLGLLNYDLPIAAARIGALDFLQDGQPQTDEYVDNVRDFKTLRQWFERKIRYWECRPMPADPAAVVSPADARVMVGSFHTQHSLFIKGKFFDYEELLGADKMEWLRAFRDGDFAIFRLTPDKYHYNHIPVSGIIKDFYEIQGACHSCNPNAVVAMVTPFSKNRRVITIIDTDCAGGSGVGLVAMIEIVALMIGDIVPCYSAYRYENPAVPYCGMPVKKGQPKSLYRPGSSTTVLVFQKGRCRFCDDICANRRRHNISSRFSAGFGQPLVETDLKVRSLIAWPPEHEGLHS
ncbi:MAG: phosphatidylserine decarboxylase [Kiritimatiellia bacterium]|jgi:phosphatidylserine decarboxylase